MKKKSPSENKKYHFIGIGGVGTSGLAMILMKEKAHISGSDMQDSTLLNRLVDSGADVKIGHTAANLPDELDGVVISAAVRDDNPELLAARQRKIMIYKYAQMLGLVMDRYRGVAISGTHGKSTTSGWLTYVLQKIGLDPNFLIGADVMQLGVSSGLGDSDVFVAEACEYDRSFLNLHPKVGVILNIEPDHLDYYSGIGEIVEAFAAFANNIASDGVLVAGIEDLNAAKIVAHIAGKKDVFTFGLTESATFYAKNIEYAPDNTSFDCFYKDRLLGRAVIKLAGEHNVRNALAVLASVEALGGDTKQAIHALGGFEGMDRRLMKKAEIAGVTVFDDYAHHPTEIRATLAGIAQKWPKTALICVFQPHQAQRIRTLFKEFIGAFNEADILVLLDVYKVAGRDSSASLPRQNSRQVRTNRAQSTTKSLSKQLTSAIINRQLSKSKNTRLKKVLYLPNPKKLKQVLKNFLRGSALSPCQSAIVVMMGAGDIYKLTNKLIE
ncbi:MAG TPA: UDP-N-acetylmuramate--L-alanine ligase [Phycisphaerales bacterium]|nr:UDP-N-acetylmuramate--L-alanine ligase [Phycisphaerales bacterium]